MCLYSFPAVELPSPPSSWRACSSKDTSCFGTYSSLQSKCLARTWNMIGTRLNCFCDSSCSSIFLICGWKSTCCNICKQWGSYRSYRMSRSQSRGREFFNCNRSMSINNQVFHQRASPVFKGLPHWSPLHNYRNFPQAFDRSTPFLFCSEYREIHITAAYCINSTSKQSPLTCSPWPYRPVSLIHAPFALSFHCCNS